MYSKLTALTAALVSTVSAFDCSGPYFSFYNRGGSSLSYQRLDPALFPGVESPHLHSFDGGNALTADLSFANTQSASCTTARIKADKSLYWKPVLFWNGNNTGFYRVPDQHLKIYYKFGDGNERANVTEFPENHKMIAGNPFLRHDDGKVGGSGGPGIGWSCKGKGGSHIDAVGFPKGFTSCSDGFAAQITFPNCWNGKEIDPKNPNAHVAYATGEGKGIDACPPGFKVARFPTIFIEFWYDVSSFDNHYSADSIPWVLANGDSTGYGFHADFLNGWEKGVLAKATAQTGYCNCGCDCGEDQMKVCFGADGVNDNQDSAFKSCTAKAQFPGDEKSPLDKLPGCNPIQSGPADATQASGAGCDATPAPGSGSSANSGSAVGSSAAATKASSTNAPMYTSPPILVSSLLSLPGKQVASEGGGSKQSVTSDNSDIIVSDKATATPSMPGSTPVGSLPTFVFPSSKAQTDNQAALSVSTTAVPAQSSAAADGQCPPPVYVTITPTVYVTAGDMGSADKTAPCESGTVYKTVTNKVTVTVQPSAAGYRHKRHADIHHH